MDIKNILTYLFSENIYCMACGKIISNKTGLCNDCLKKIIWTNTKICEKCGRIFVNEIKHISLCKDCKKDEPYFDKAFSICLYDDLTKQIVISLKNGHRFQNGKNIAYLIYQRLKKIDQKIDMILPIPLYKKKLNIRGFNQAEIISNYLSKYLNLPFYKDVLIKIKNTKDTKKLSTQERLVNLKNAFHVNHPEKIERKNILVVDDIFTTGATANTVSKLLKNNNVNKVYFVSFTTRLAKKYSGDEKLNVKTSIFLK